MTDIQSHRHRERLDDAAAQLADLNGAPIDPLRAPVDILFDWQVSAMTQDTLQHSITHTDITVSVQSRKPRRTLAARRHHAPRLIPVTGRQPNLLPHAIEQSSTTASENFSELDAVITALRAAAPQ